MSTEKALEGRLAVVTGASRGIGRAMALELARAGAHIIAVARTTGALEELDDLIRRETGEGATLVPLDVTDGPGVDRLGAAIFERWKKLDILFANAGAYAHECEKRTHPKAGLTARGHPASIGSTFPIPQNGKNRIRP